MIRENLDIGRPSHVQLIFDRRVSRSTPGRFRTRVITDGVIPSLHVDYKNSRIKQHHKEGRALRTETTINNTRDFGIGKKLKNPPALRQVGFQANRRLLDVQKVFHDCSIGEDAFHGVVRPVGRMTYDLRHLRLHGIIERIPRSQLRPKLAEIMPQGPPNPSTLHSAFDRLEAEIDACEEKKLAA